MQWQQEECFNAHTAVRIIVFRGDYNSRRIGNHVCTTKMVGVDVARNGCTSSDATRKPLIDCGEQCITIEDVLGRRRVLRAADCRRRDGVKLAWINPGCPRAGLENSLAEGRRMRKSLLRRQRRGPSDGLHNPK